MKYVIDVDLEDNDCSFCPCFARHDYSYADCNLAERDLESRYDTTEDGKNYVICYDRPDWCPLVTFDECLLREWMENANSQPEKDEEKTVVRLELYESEWAKAGALSLKYRLTMAQTIAMLIERAYGNEVPH